MYCKQAFWADLKEYAPAKLIRIERTRRGVCPNEDSQKLKKNITYSWSGNIALNHTIWWHYWEGQARMRRNILKLFRDFRNVEVWLICKYTNYVSLTFLSLICIPNSSSELFSRIMGMRTLWGRRQGFCRVWNGTTPYVLISKPSAVEVSPFCYIVNIARTNPNIILKSEQKEVTLTEIFASHTKLIL